MERTVTEMDAEQQGAPPGLVQLLPTRAYEPPPPGETRPDEATSCLVRGREARVHLGMRGRGSGGRRVAAWRHAGMDGAAALA